MLVVQETLPHYRLPFFEGLRAALRGDGIALRLLAGRPDAVAATKRDTRRLPWAEDLAQSRLRVGGRQVVWQHAVRASRRADLVIVEQAARLVSNLPLLLLQRHGGARVALWGHGFPSRPHAALATAERFKAISSRHPSWWFAYTETSAERVRELGFPPERITTVQNAVDTTSLRAAPKPVSTGMRFTFVGGLYAEKRLDFLVQVADRLAEHRPDVEVHVVGDGPERAFLEQHAGTRPYLVLHGALFGRARDDLLLSSTLLLMPGLVGLVALDAFAARTPVVTTAVPFHGPEFSYLVPGVNSIVLDGTATPDEYARVLVATAQDARLMHALRTGCAAAAARYTVEAMVERFATGVHGALSTR